MSWLEHYQKNKFRYEVVMLVLYLLINQTIIATSVVMEQQRSGDPSSEMWEPFVWEYSSGIGTLLMFGFIVWVVNRFPFNWQAIGRSLLTYLAASVVFTIGHVGIMVSLRKLIYWLRDRYYDFGNFWFEMLYEYRKDLWGFLLLVGVILAYRFILSRLQGEASPIHEGESGQEEKSSPKSIDRLLVKKLGKEFIIKVDDIEWLEASGNYVNLHIGERIYPLRASLANLTEQLSKRGFCRIHRSYGVRLDAIESITPLSSGDSEVKLASGKVLTLSRRYKDGFKEQLGT